MKPVRFALLAPHGSEVYVGGTFNNWDVQRHPLHDNPGEGIFVATLPLPRGRYEYKFVVNGTWFPDPACRESVSNPFGSFQFLRELRGFA